MRDINHLRLEAHKLGINLYCMNGQWVCISGPADWREETLLHYSINTERAALEDCIARVRANLTEDTSESPRDLGRSFSEY